MDMIILYIIYNDLSTSIFVFHTPYCAMQHQTPVSLATARLVFSYYSQTQFFVARRVVRRGCYTRWRCVGSRNKLPRVAAALCDTAYRLHEAIHS